MKKVVFFVFGLLVATVSAQNISNVDFHVVGDEIVVTYNLDESADVWLYVSLDGGKTYCSAVTTTGDVGRAVLSGKKRILWKVLYDIPEGLAGQIRFKVSTNAVFFIDGMELEMVYVKGGTFMMGTPENFYDSECNDFATGLKDERNDVCHQVTLSDYYIGKFEVTQGLWTAVMGSTIEEQRDKTRYSFLSGVGSDYPMYYVNWDEAQEFCQKLSQLTGKTYVLPTEAQWEYAARGGMKSKGYKYSGSNYSGEVAWSGDYINDKWEMVVHSVGMKQPNELGIYDMSGNASEMCSDWYDYSYYGSGVQTDPTGPVFGNRRVERGGGALNRGWCTDWYCQVSIRNSCDPSERNYNCGFRVALLP